MVKNKGHENIKPPKKGEIRNPKGKAKGTLNRETLFKKWLEVSQKVKNPINQKIESLSQYDLVMLALIKKARSGDVNAIREIMDSSFGKLKEQIDTNQTIKQEIDYSKLSNETLLELLKAKKSE